MTTSLHTQLIAIHNDHTYITLAVEKVPLKEARNKRTVIACSSELIMQRN